VNRWRGEAVFLGTLQQDLINALALRKRGIYAQGDMAVKRTPPAIDWYRSPISTELFKQLHKRSDWLGWVQTGGFLLIVAATGSLAYFSWSQGWPWLMTVPLIFLHGMVSNFHINGMHELEHGTVFKTKSLNAFFMRVVSFLGWINFEIFISSHQRHHRHTLHPPDDQEVMLPVKILKRDFLHGGFINLKGGWWVFLYTLRIARGKMETPWELYCYPPEKPELRIPPVRWARTLLLGHGLIIAVSVAMGWWMLPVLTTLAPFYGGWLFFLCNNTQHVGLQDNVPDFRLCCRTIILSPVLRFLYWQMNFHTEHHMYAAVPCYHLKRLHEAIEHDLPPSPKGLVATWREIGGILRRQEVEPDYQYRAPLPDAAERRY